MTVALYARRKQWALQTVTVELRYSRIHAEDCADCDVNDRRIDRIEWRINLEGELTGSERERLIEIAQRCPVHRTLASRTDIRPFAEDLSGASEA